MPESASFAIVSDGLEIRAGGIACKLVLEGSVADAAGTRCFEELVIVLCCKQKTEEDTEANLSCRV